MTTEQERRIGIPSRELIHRSFNLEQGEDPVLARRSKARARLSEYNRREGISHTDYVTSEDRIRGYLFVPHYSPLPDILTATPLALSFTEGILESCFASGADSDEELDFYNERDRVTYNLGYILIHFPSVASDLADLLTKGIDIPVRHVFDLYKDRVHTPLDSLTFLQEKSVFMRDLEREVAATKNFFSGKPFYEELLPGIIKQADNDITIGDFFDPNNDIISGIPLFTAYEELFARFQILSPQEKKEQLQRLQQGVYPSELFSERFYLIDVSAETFREFYFSLFVRDHVGNLSPALIQEYAAGSVFPLLSSKLWGEMARTHTFSEEEIIKLREQAETRLRIYAQEQLAQQKKHPFYTTVHHPEVTNPLTLTDAYRQNTKEVSEEVHDLVTNSLRNDEWEGVLSSDRAFTGFILSLHRIACMGKSGDRWYRGRSFIRFTEENAGVLRDVTTREGDITMSLQTTNPHFKQLLSYAEVLEDPISKGVLKAFGRTLPSLYPNGSTYPVHFPNVLVVAVGGMRYSPLERDIHQSLSSMRRVLRATLRQVDETADPFEKQLVLCNGLALFEQVGIQSQAVLSVWNSLLMGGIINTLLETHGALSPIPHRNLDSATFFLSPKTYGKLFTATILHEQQQIEKYQGLFEERINTDHVLDPTKIENLIFDREKVENPGEFVPERIPTEIFSLVMSNQFGGIQDRFSQLLQAA